jgi:hypothetical protein
VSYWKSSESRAAVANFLLFLPLTIISLKVGTEGMINFCVLLDNLLIRMAKMMTEQSNSTTTSINTVSSSLLTPQMERHLEDAFLGVTAGMLGMICILLNFIDERSSKNWKGVRIQGLGRPPIVGDVIAISSFTFYVIVMEYYGGGIKAQFLWMMVMLSSTLFPAAILSLSHHAARTVSDSFIPTAANMISVARSIEPLLFGLRYGLLATYFGMEACLDAIVIVGLLPRNTRDKHLKDCFVGQIPSGICILFMGAKLATWGYDIFVIQSAAAAADGADQSTPSFASVTRTIVDSLLAASILRLTTFATFHMFGLGVTFGNQIATASRGHVRLDGSPTKDYNNWGILIFTSWAISLLILIQL